MAEALLGWARNIIYYMVFLSLAEHLLAGSSYGRYLRLFGGLVLVLVVLGPFGSLGDWEKQVSSLFDQFTFRQESRELKKEIFGMEEKRLAGITGQYRENVEKEITALVKAQGIVCSQVSVQMEENKERAKELYNLGKKELTQAHKVQTDLLISEANGEKVNTNVILIHAQDHLMTTIMYERIAKQMIRILDKEAKL